MSVYRKRRKRSREDVSKGIIRTRTASKPPFLLEKKLNEAIAKRSKFFVHQCKFDESRLSKIRMSSDRTLYMTNYGSADCLQTLKKHKISSIISLGKTNVLSFEIQKALNNYVCIDVEDTRDPETAQILANKVFPRTRTLLKKFLKEGNVLIHCRQGKCRTPLVALDFLMNVLELEQEVAVAALTNDRLCILPGAILLRSLF